MEVKVTFEDFDLEAEVEKAVYDEIRKIAGIEVRQIFKDAKVDYVSLDERVNKQISTRINTILNGKSDQIDKVIERTVERVLDKEIDGIIRKKVAKVMSPYINILEEKAKEVNV